MRRLLAVVQRDIQQDKKTRTKPAGTATCRARLTVFVGRSKWPRIKTKQGTRYAQRREGKHLNKALDVPSSCPASSFVNSAKSRSTWPPHHFLHSFPSISIFILSWLLRPRSHRKCACHRVTLVLEPMYHLPLICQ